MNFDGKTQPIAPSVQDSIRLAGQKKLSEADFYSGAMLKATRKDIRFVAVPTEEIIRALPQVTVALTLRSAQATARLRQDYEKMLAKSGLRNFLKKQFRKTVQQTCDWMQRDMRHHRAAPDREAIMREFLSYDLHHRVPLALGGTNAYENLVFIPRPVHNKIHDVIRMATPHLAVGVTEVVAIPYPRGIFPVRPRGRAARSTPHEAATV